MKCHRSRDIPGTFWLRLMDWKIDKNSYPFSSKSNAVCWMQTWASIPNKMTYVLLTNPVPLQIPSKVSSHIEKTCRSNVRILSDYVNVISQGCSPMSSGYISEQSRGIFPNILLAFAINFATPTIYRHPKTWGFHDFCMSHWKNITLSLWIRLTLRVSIEELF